MKRYVILIAGCAFFAGCATMVEPKPGTITLEEALRSVGKGLVLMKQAEFEQNNNKRFKTGLLASEAEVTFNISATGSKDGKLYVELTPVPASPLPVGGKAGGSIGTSSSIARGNQITIKFRSLAFTKKTATPDGKEVIIEGPTDAKVLTEVLKALEEKDITVYMQ